jgi:periplasmic protein TonB
MNNAFTMDQSEKVGLGAAIGGHALLVALLVFGLFKAAVPTGSDGGGSGDGIAVEIVSEGAASAAPAAQIEPVEAALPEPAPLPEAIVDPEPTPLPQPKPLPKAIAKPTPVAKPAAKAEPQPKPQTRPGTGRGTGSSDFDRRMQDTLGKIGGGGSGAAPKKGAGEGTGQGASTKTASQISREVNAVLGPKIMRYIRQCAPTGPEVNKLITTATLNLNANGTIASLTGVSQRGVTEGNRAQADPMQRCVTSAIRKAAPFTELNPQDYEGWKTHRMAFQPN